MVYTIPFLSYLIDTKTNITKYCLINLISKDTISFYNIHKLEPDEYNDFMLLAEKWWNSCPIIPISVFYHYEIKRFEHIKEIIMDNNYKILKGFSGVSLNNLTDKRIKRHIINIDMLKKKLQKKAESMQS